MGAARRPPQDPGAAPDPPPCDSGRVLRVTAASGRSVRALTALVDLGEGEVRCDVGALPADLDAVDLIARLRLAARRSGCRLSFRGASRALLELLALAGLTEVLDPAPVSGLEARREAEEREGRGGVEE